MVTPLRALLIDDSEEDVELLVRHLRRDGYELSWARVDTADALRAALRQQAWDIALCDYVMPGFSGREALAILRAEAPELPTIAVSGQVGEEYAVEVMRDGARDYVRKDNLSRLAPAITRELLDAETQRSRKRAEAGLRAAESWMQLAVDSAALGQFDYDVRTNALLTSPRWKANLGYAPDEIPDRFEEFERRLHPDDHARVMANVRAEVDGVSRFTQQEFRLQHRDGSYHWFLSRSAAEVDQSGAVFRVLGCSFDITERKQAEDELRTGRERLRLITETIAEVFWMADVDLGRILYVSPGYERIWGRPCASLYERPASFLDAIHTEDRARAVDALRPEGGAQAFADEYRVVRPDGSVRWVWGHGYPVRDEAGTVTAYVGVAQDITERKEAEARVREQEHAYASLLQSTTDAVWVVDRHGHLLDVNAAACQMTGYTRDELLQMLIPDLDARDDAAEVARNLERMSQEGSARFESRHRCKGGRLIDVDVSTTYVPQQGGRFYAFIRDITDRKKVEDRLREQSVLLDLAHDAIIACDLQRRILFWNRGAERKYGWTAAEVTGRVLHDVLQTIYPSSVEARDAALLDHEEWEGELTHTSRDGSRVVVASRQSLQRDEHGAPIAVLEVNRDITGRKQAEAELRAFAEVQAQDRRLFQSVLDHLVQGVVVVAADWTPVWNNPAALHLHGIASHEEAVAHRLDYARFLSAWTLDGQPVPVEQWPLIRGLRGEVVTAVELRVQRLDTGKEWIGLYDAVPIRDADGTLAQVVLTVSDITERKQAEAALQASEHRLREVTEALPQLVWTCLPDGSCEYLSRQWVQYTGIAEAEQLGTGWLQQLHPDDRDATVAAWQQAVRTGLAFDVEFRIRGSDGVYRWFKTRAVPMRDADGAIVRWFGSNTDFDDEKRLQQEIRALNAELAQRVEDRTAQLQAANKELEAFNYSVSHDLRTPLRHIDGFIDVLEEDYGHRLPEAAHQCLTRVRAGTQHMNRMIEGLLRLSRVGRAAIQPRRVDLTELAQAAFAGLQEEESHRVVEFVVGELPEVNGDPVLLRQLLDNLLGNALKFTRPVSSPGIEVGSERRGGEDVFYLRDNGVGFDAANAETLFGVFQRFHPATEFEGTGVGLSIVKRIVERHGGRIWAESAPGKGATFWFTLGSPTA